MSIKTKVTPRKNNNQKSKKYILIIDDDPAFIRLLKNYLVVDDKYEIQHSLDAETGLTMVKKQKPDLILLDILLPRMSGIDFLKKLRADSKSADVSVLIISQLSDVQRISDCAQYKIAGYIVKADTSLEDVTNKIDEILRYS